MKSIRTILQEADCSLAQSVYEDTSILDYEIPVDHGWELKKVNLEQRSFKKVRKYLDEVYAGKHAPAYLDLKAKIKAVPRECRAQKAALRKQKKETRAEIQERAFANAFPCANPQEPICAVSYKSGVYAINLAELMPRFLADSSSNETSPEQINTIKCPLLCARPENIPWFLSDVEWFMETRTKANILGMEGGYCILGTDEMLFHIFLMDGAEHIFDFNTMQELTGAAQDIITCETDTALWDFMQTNSDRVQNVVIECDKDRITVDEYAQLYYLFVMADFFDAKLVVTIPDMSYEKTFIQTFGEVQTELFEKVHADFLAHLDRISDICIAWVEEFRKSFPELEVEVLHRRNEDFLNIFYEKREAYLDSYAKKHLTTIRDGRRDALMDYVCMPAAPFYRWGTRDVIEVNRLEEYPSIEKCKRIHRGAMHLHSMLFPQAPCRNGVTSGFYARRKYKEYVEM